MSDRTARLEILSTAPLVLRGGSGDFAVRGASFAESVGEGLRLHRLPKEALSWIHTEFFRAVEPQTSGVRVAACTAATELQMTVSTVALRVEGDYPPPSWGRVDLTIDGQLHSSRDLPPGGVRTVDLLADSSTVSLAAPVTVRFEGLPAHAKTIELWLPYDVEVLLVDVTADAAMTIPEDDSAVWVHYGSSVSQGFNAEGPTGSWPAVAAADASVSLVNLGFSGSALLDWFVAQAIRNQRADVVSLEVGVNVVNHDAFRARTFVPALQSFLQIVRQGHPTVPIWVVSSVLCPIIEDRPGPTTMTEEPGQRKAVAEGQPEDLVRGRLSLGVIRDLIRDSIAAWSRDDPNLYYLDGRQLYGPAEFDEMPIVDGLHPDALAQAHIGHRFAQSVLNTTHSPLGRSS